MTNPTDVVREIEQSHDITNRNLAHLSDPERRKHAVASNDALRDIALRLAEENVRLKAELQGLVDDGTIVRDDNA